MDQRGKKARLLLQGKKAFLVRSKDPGTARGFREVQHVFLDLRSRTANIEQTGLGIAYIHDDFSERDAKT